MNSTPQKARSTPSLDDIRQMFEQHGYISDPQIEMSLYLALQLRKPLLIEGPAGVGKTAIAHVMAQALRTELIRLQCYEGLDATHALYEWNYPRQLLYLQILDRQNRSADAIEADLFSEKFLLRRPLLNAISQPHPVVLLIDEIDRADEEFESFLLELLSEWQITIPEIGTIRAQSIPHVILTGNRTRELSEALRRRCLYLWIDYPSPDKELQIIHAHIPHIHQQLAQHITAFMYELRQLKLEKTPGISETIDWAQTLATLHYDHLDKHIIEQTLGVILKNWEDMRLTRDSLSDILEKTGIQSRFL